MKVIIKTNEIEFNDLNDRIHQALITNLPKYNATKWSEPIINQSSGEYACIIEDTGLRSAIILAFVLTEDEKNNIIELNKEDTNWFPVIEEDI
jgi:NOL1/NOP2/fmu family ribosome biogenesis protein